MTETTVVIPHSGSTETLIAVLIQLQMQTVPPVHIYIIDCSKDKSGLRIAQKFSYNNIPIKVEVRKGTIYENWNVGIQWSQKEHPKASILIINDDILLPVNAVALFEQVAVRSDALCLVPETPPRDHYMPYVTVEFKNVASIQYVEKTNWMSGFVFYLKPEAIQRVGLFDEHYKVWYGDTDYERRLNIYRGIEIIRGLYVYHFGGKSYQYQSEEVQAKIQIDRQIFNEKYHLV